MPALAMPEHTPINQMTASIILPNHHAALPQLSRWVQHTSHACGLPDRCAFRLELVLVELVTNIIEHGEIPAGAAGIEVQVAVVERQVLVQVEEPGIPFDPTAAPAHSPPASLEDAPIGGLGLHLVRSYVQTLEYQRIGSRNQLRMTLDCDG